MFDGFCSGLMFGLLFGFWFWCLVCFLGIYAVLDSVGFGVC